MVPPAPMIEALGFAVNHVRRADLDVLIMLHAPLDVPLCVEARIVLGGNLLRAFGN